VWFNGSAQSPFLYDRAWGGMVMCGCDYNGDTHGCNNVYPNCPALVDMGQNFGAGFYNDHHYHFGYIIYAAAVVCKFNHVWCKKYHEHTMLLIRDIANPSKDDPFFPTFRHKDWYLGFSWASGIVTIGGIPYPNGRNQESSSEAIAAYEAVALYGDVTAQVFETPSSDSQLYDSAQRMRDMGRLLLATEIRSAKTYWHVQDRQTAAAPLTTSGATPLPVVPIVSRIYPDEYKAKVVGMLWSMLAQEQTWFGLEPWKSYGIQLMPLTVASEQRDDPAWINEMLPDFQNSCTKDLTCAKQGWSVMVYSCMAVNGQWREAWAGVNSLNGTIYEEAGGNGHSKVNTLWYVATRPDVDNDRRKVLERDSE
jgi:endo-1,3(4)-beta-glucanase